MFRVVLALFLAIVVFEIPEVEAQLFRRGARRSARAARRNAPEQNRRTANPQRGNRDQAKQSSKPTAAKKKANAQPEKPPQRSASKNARPQSATQPRRNTGSVQPAQRLTPRYDPRTNRTYNRSVRSPAATPNQRSSTLTARTQSARTQSASPNVRTQPNVPRNNQRDIARSQPVKPAPVGLQLNAPVQVRPPVTGTTERSAERTFTRRLNTAVPQRAPSPVNSENAGPTRARKKTFSVLEYKN